MIRRHGQPGLHACRQLLHIDAPDVELAPKGAPLDNQPENVALALLLAGQPLRAPPEVPRQIIPQGAAGLLVRPYPPPRLDRGVVEADDLVADYGDRGEAVGRGEAWLGRVSDGFALDVVAVGEVGGLYEVEGGGDVDDEG